MGDLRRAVTALGAAIAAALVVAAPASALVSAGGAAIPNTSTVSESAQLDGAPSLLALLAAPSSPDDDDADALSALGAPDGPEEDLGAALDRLAGADDPDEARAARRLALDVLEGNPLDRAYSGIPLLNWNAPAKVKTVAAGGTVTVRQVRFGEHLVSDTWLLRFQDPAQPFRIAYEVTELGGTFGGELMPTPLLADGPTPIGGMHSAVAPLALPELETGTFASSRFHPEGEAEHTRLGTQRIVVRMPPPRHVTAILDPSLQPGREALATLAPATPERLAAAEQALGFEGESPSSAQRRAAIARLADDAPEKRIWTALDALDPQAPGFLGDARAAGAATRPLVAPMRTRSRLPSGVAADPGADVTVALMNNEAYVSAPRVRLAPGAALKVAVVNRDGFAHDLSALELRGGRPVFGPVNWGEFDWSSLGATGPLAPGETRLMSVAPAANAFALWVGDRGSGDQASAAIALERGPRVESLRFGPDFAAPRHVAEDPDGRLWVTLEGVDKIARVDPADDLAASGREEYLVPGGAHDLGSTRPPLAPADVFVDAKGIVWVTLTLGNAIARVDPALTRDGTADGITIHPLEPCPPGEAEGGSACRVEFPADPGALPSRGPLQLDGMLDADGNTVLFFTEMNMDAIGVMRFAPDGTRLNRVDVPCGCVSPLGIGLGGDGSLWFTEGDTNAIGRLRLDRARPYVASTARIDHHPIPFGTMLQDPDHPDPIFTAAPHSLALDGRGRVWFTGEAVSKVAYLDPRHAQPGTQHGFTAFDTGHSEFGGITAPADLAIDRAGVVHWSDEYGDVVGRLDSGGPLTGLRPTERRSLTDSPLVDSSGDLWFLELGSNLLTRVDGVSEGAPRPAPQPVVEARTSDDAVTAHGLREVGSATVEVRRDGGVVATATAAVSGGQIQIDDGDWSTAASDALRAGDVVRFAAQGTHPREPLSFEVAALTAAVNGAGAIAGRATLGGAPLGGHVDVRVGARDLRAGLDPVDGRFAHAPAPALAPGEAGTVAWSEATVGLVFRTVTRFPDAPDVEPRRPAPPLPPAPPESAPPVATPPTVPAPAECAAHWLTGRGRGARVQLLGMSVADLTRCLGRPSARSARRGTSHLRFDGKLAVRVRGGRVTAYELAAPGLRSRTGRLGLGSSLARLRRVLRGVAFRVRGDEASAAIATATGAKALVTVGLSYRKPRRIVRIAVDPLPRPARSGKGRALRR